MDTLQVPAISAYEGFSDLCLIMHAAARSFRLLCIPEDNSFPVPVRDIAEKAGATVRVRDLSIADIQNPPQSIGMLTGLLQPTEDGKAIIYIEESASAFQKNWAIAHELGRFWLQSCQGKAEIGRCFDTRLALDCEDRLSDIFAVFLLLPISAFFREAQHYVEANAHRLVFIDEILGEISRIAEIPYYWAIAGFEYIKAAISSETIRREVADNRASFFAQEK